MIGPGKLVSLGIACALAAAVGSIGCGINRRYARDTMRQLPYSEIAIEYTVHEPETSTTSGEASDDPAGLEHGNMTLSVVYPHSNARLGRNYAEVTLRQGRAHAPRVAEKAASGFITGPIRQLVLHAAVTDPGDGSVLHMTLRRDELEELVDGLIADGVFDGEKRTGDVEIGVTLDARSTHKSWDRIEAMEQLATRVRSTNQEHQKSASPVIPRAPAELLAPDPADDAATLLPPIAATPGDPVKF